MPSSFSLLLLQQSVVQPCLCPSLLPCSFLSLAGNQIRHVENLLDLQYLQFLDLSENLIETLKLGRGTGPWFMNVSFVASSLLLAPSSLRFLL